MQHFSLTSIVNRRSSLALALFTTSVCGALSNAGPVFTNVATTIQNSLTTGTVGASRVLSINTAGELEGYYTLTTNASNRIYYTLAPGATTITPYATASGTMLNYFTAAPLAGRILADGVVNSGNGNYLANYPGSPASAGFYNTTTSQYTAVPLDTRYNGTFNVTNDPTVTSQTQTATTINPYAINSSNFVVGQQVYSSTGTGNQAVTHGFIYNPLLGTTTDIGGRPEAGAVPATGFSQLNGISNNNYVVGYSSKTPSTTSSSTTSDYNGFPSDAIVGVPDVTSTDYTKYKFTDLATLLSPLADTLADRYSTTPGGNYLGSAATNISQNGRYTIGTYASYSAAESTAMARLTSVTRGFEITDAGTANAVAVDLGTIFTSLPTATNFASPVGVDNSGDVVGYGLSSGKVIHAFVYINGVISDLNTLAPQTGFTYTQAYGINDNQQIVGYGGITGGTALTAFELNLVPEPGSVSIVLAAGGLLLRRRRLA